MLNLLGVFLTLPESLTPERRAALVGQRRSLISLRAMWEALSTPRVGPLLMIRLFFGLASALVQTMLTLWAKERLQLDARSTALVLAYLGVLVVIVQGGLIGPLTKRFSEPRLIFWSTLVYALAMLAWAFTPSVPVLLVVLIPMGLLLRCVEHRH